jgi:hypothetical protein
MATKPVYNLRLDDQTLFALDDQGSFLALEEGGSTAAFVQITLRGRSTTRGTVTYRIRHLDHAPDADRLALEAEDTSDLIKLEDGGYFLTEKQNLLGR